jgi:hypothetical protein
VETLSPVLLGSRQPPQVGALDFPSLMCVSAREGYCAAVAAAAPLCAPCTDSSPLVLAGAADVGTGAGAGHLLAAAGTTVYLFDLRRPEVVLQSADATYPLDHDAASFPYIFEELNQVVFHPR